MFSVKSKIVTKQIDQLNAVEYFQKYLKAPTSTLFEVIHNKAVKPYFDYDEEVKSKEDIKSLRNKRIKAILNIMKWYFDAEDDVIQLFDASGYNPVKKIWKLSFRVLIQDHGLYTSGEVILKNIIPEITTKDIKWDTSVYKKSDKMQLLLLPYHCKEGNEKRFFQKVDTEKNTYPIIGKSKILPEEFANYFILNNMSTSSEELEVLHFEENVSVSVETGALVPDEDEYETETDDETGALVPEEEDMRVSAGGEEGEPEARNDGEPIYTYDEIKELADCLNYENQEWEWWFWKKLIWCLSNMSVQYKIDLKPLAHMISMESEKYDKKNTNVVYDQSQRKKGEQRLAIGSLIKWAEDINPDKLKLWRQRQYKKTFLYSSFTDGDIADFFIIEYKDQFKFLDNKLYYFNQVYWKECSIKILYEKLDAIYWSLKKEYNKLESELEPNRAKKMFLALHKLRTQTSIKSVCELIKIRIEIDEDFFDSKEDLLGFTNGVLDLKTGIFRDGQYDDYITKIIPYDFEECKGDEIKFAQDHFAEVFPDPEVRDLFFLTLSSGLRGRVLQKFLIWTGCGANSKGVTSKIVRTVFGENLYYKGNNSVLTQEVKGDLCVGIASMHNKRVITYEEPSANRKIITNMMKELTGGDVMAYRGLYSSKTKVGMRATHIMMCNKKPLLDQIDEAVNRRLTIIPFESQFRTRDHIQQFIPEGTPNVFVAKDGVEDGDFLEKIKLPFLHILLRYYQVFKNNGYQITNVPAKCQALVKEYMTASDEFTTWFNDAYEFTNNDDDFVKMVEVYHKYKDSELYQNLDKKTRRLKGSKKAITTDIKDNPTLKMYFRERMQTNRIVADNVMIRYKERVADEDEDED